MTIHTPFELSCYTRRRETFVIPAVEVEPTDFSKIILEHVTNERVIFGSRTTCTFHHNHRKLISGYSFRLGRFHREGAFLAFSVFLRACCANSEQFKDTAVLKSQKILCKYEAEESRRY